MYRVMLVDDDGNVLRALRRVLAQSLPGLAPQSRIAIEAFVSPHAALDRARETAFALVITDYRMPVMDGITLLRHIAAIQPDAMRMILSAAVDLNALVSAINDCNVFRYVAKPWNGAELRSAVAHALRHGDLLRENRQLADEVRAQRRIISAQEVELRRLEAEEPGITKVNWGPDGAVMLES